jgi:hypothetical protein
MVIERRKEPTMGTTTTTAFDLARFARAAEERDASTQLSMYAPGATVTIVDRNTQPAAPRVLRTHEEIGTWLQEMYGRDVSHSVAHTVSDATGAAYTQTCRYPDGTDVVCATVLELDGGAIHRQTLVQVWDER